MIFSYKIYGIYDKKTHDIIYVGKTSQNLHLRWISHRCATRMGVYKYMMGNGGIAAYFIDVIHHVKTRQEADEWERHFIQEMEPQCNIYLMS